MEMSKRLQITLLTIGGIVAVAALLFIGISIGRAVALSPDAWWQGTPTLRTYPYTGSMMESPGYEHQYRNSMMGQGMMGSGMMGFGMMGYGQVGLPFGGGMMGQYGSQSLTGIEPIEIDDARSAVESYLAGLEDENLEIGEIMIFDNHAYAQILEQDTGIGALELLVDPVTLVVYPEHGPTMMWNLKYSPMSGFGGFGMMGMMGASFSDSDSSMRGMMDEQVDAANAAIDSDEAVEIAQRYLDAYVHGTEADDHADSFYGYYTLHIERDGEVVGMLSVNGTTGQVWLHDWHGELVEISDHE
jgi:hypothetical protein